MPPSTGARPARSGIIARRVPILFWRKAMKGFEQLRAVEPVDILPTIARQIGLALPTGSMDGRCLDLQRQGAPCR